MSVPGETGGAPGSVRTRLNYLTQDSEPPVSRIGFEAPDEVHRSGEYEWVEVAVGDARRLDPPARLDSEGFELVRFETAVADLYDDDLVKSAYYPEVSRLVRDTTGAARVVVFDHNSRAEGGPRAAHGNARAPVHLVHDDYTDRSAPGRVRAFLPEDEAADLLTRRFAIVNVWRPIRGPLLSTPLALCDARSIAPGDLVAAQMVYPHRTGEEFRSRHSRRHRWYYYPRMTADEAVLIKVFDSATDGLARFSLHSAFDDPTTPADAPPRESIEARTLVFY
ncbi:MAG: CmcJ/NvfI family oxidoreductase [Proteobacteria bacterium]|nr:CmcJ/NvfI family oxidoreductase [Pseudomonadota bacterium]